MEAVSLSMSMTLKNMEVTSKLYYTLFLVYIRTIITIVVFMIFPLIFSIIFAFVTSETLFILSMSVIGLALFAFMVFVSHLNSVLEIFVDALWYNAYLENKKLQD